MQTVYSTFSKLRGLLSAPDIAIDLGTANTRLYARGRGLIADEPSLVAIDRVTGEVAAVGVRAAALADEGRRRRVSPLRAGVVADLDATVSLLEPLIHRASRFGWARPRVLACIPTDAGQEEQAALEKAVRAAGASAVAIVPEPLAAAIGAGIDVASRHAHMLVDIGDGVTDIAVIRESELIATSALRTACSDLHEAVKRRVVRQSGVLLLEGEAERLTREIGTARGLNLVGDFSAQGRHRVSGRPIVVRVGRQEVATSLEPIIGRIVEAVGRAVKALPPKTASEIIESGICLTGGGARLHGMAELIETETGVTVKTAPDPMRAVINGARQMLDVAAQTDLWTN
ncbi:MAG: rod shape-determining protein [Acidobacteria bacterium]|nr:rod shape-determining protein [Acidobacteriota bacterium]MCW5969612.1 rod shape-determining protein [Blastocatellales bacterium]